VRRAPHGSRRLACDAAGVGGAEEGGNELTVRAAVPFAFELPGREATEVNVMALNVRRPAVAYELNLELHLISLDWFATYRAGLTDAGSARCAVRSSRRQLSSANLLLEPCPEEWARQARSTPTSTANSIAFDDSSPVGTIGNSEYLRRAETAGWLSRARRSRTL
jgi:hypothetical protein